MIKPQFKDFDSLPVPVSVLELDANARPCYVALNSAWCETAQLSEETVLGRTAIELFGEHFGTKAYLAHVHAFSSGDIVDDEVIVPINGQERFVRTKLTPVLDDKGGVTRVIAMPVDITSEVELREVEARTAIINKEMEQFISLAAHDLRSPMRKVHQIASMLRLDLPNLSDDDAQLLDMLENVATKSLQMITDLVNHSNAADIASTKISLEPYSLLELTNNILQTIDPERKHDLQVDDACILGERVAAQVVVRNLLDNAIKHNKENLKLSVSARQAGSELVQIAVSDDGTGFSTGGKRQIQEGRLSAQGGFGIAGIRRLIASRGGSITLDEPVPGEGATIRVKLPGTIEDRFERSKAV